ncbi:DUF2997 domain-containing protein [Paenibacillus sp. WQ 127069]|uniref:DUF2997 domain-containing protein n=1 Tax=Paenibacillus baimaensis TaxID=2982185 RepID=A0ABT2UF07_9BACL|nr:DUF2997 domain-containing protein [Paenibacillus sp. WQ 127069]MCU6793228.1 DUF2997 domain-containing protein [Paenibacillus sp. WQ 127069]
MKQIVITVGTDGSVSIEAQNYKGSECDAATRPFEAALGQITKKRRKPEFYAAEQGNVSKHEKFYE